VFVAEKIDIDCVDDVFRELFGVKIGLNEM